MALINTGMSKNFMGGQTKPPPPQKAFAGVDPTFMGAGKTPTSPEAFGQKNMGAGGTFTPVSDPRDKFRVPTTPRPSSSDIAAKRFALSEPARQAALARQLGATPFNAPHSSVGQFGGFGGGGQFPSWLAALMGKA